MNTHIRPLPLAALALAIALPAFAAEAPTQAQKISAVLAKSLAPAAAPAASTPQQLAHDYPVLSKLPAGMGEFLVIRDLGGLAQQLGGGVPPELAAIKGVAIGSASANAPLCSALMDIAQSLNGSPLGGEAMDKAMATLGGHALHPIHLVITCQKGQEEVLKQLAQAVAANPYLSPADDLPEGFSGGRINWEAVNGEDENHKVNPAVKELQQQHRPYVLTQLKAGALHIVLCEKPAEVKLPAILAESVLGGSAAKALKPGAEGQKAVAALHLSPAFNRDMQKESWGSLAELCAQFGELTGGKLPGLKTLADDFKARAELPVKHATVLQAWQDDRGFTIGGSMDAQGTSYKPGTFRLMSYADKPSTIFYAESTAVQPNKKLAGFSTLLGAVAEVAASTLVAQTVPTSGVPAGMGEDGGFEDGEEAAATPAAAPADQTARLKAAASALSSLFEGLNGNFAIVMDGQGTAPAAIGLPEGTAIPRLGITLGVSKRALLGKGWDTLVSSLGLDGQLPIESKTSGKVTRYSIENPMFNKDFLPNLIVTDKQLAMGSSAPMNVALLKAMGKKGSPTGAGSVFMFRAKPFAKCVGGILKAQAQDGSDEAFVLDSPAGAAIDQFAEVVDTVHGCTTVEQGVFTLELRVDFAK